ncbi:MAG: glycosyltransferase family A protein [Aestuariivirga sp.]
MLSLITTCKNRLSHLKQTLPLMLQQSYSEVIVVDYGCEQGTAAWVKQNYPKAKVVQVKDDPVFSLALARNIGAKTASHEFLCFIDADVVIYQDLGEWLKRNNDPMRLYLYPVQRERELSGFAMMAREQFLRIGGYDEAFRGWGGEDKDLYERLQSTGLIEFFVPKNSISSIPHGNELRQLGKEAGGYDSMSEALSMNQLYRMIKRDIWKLTNTEIELENRLKLLNLIKTTNREAKMKGEKVFEIAIGVPMDLNSNEYARSLRRLIYKTPVRQATH